MMPALLSPKVIQAISTLDSHQSMLGLAIRDAVDNSPRIYQAYRRNPHEGRERFIEEFVTTLIWGFGISSAKGLYDLVAPKINSKLSFPALDFRMISGNNPQRLTADVVNKYAVGADKKKLLTLLKSPALQKLYKGSSVSRFLVSTIVPAMFLGFALPKINQSITRYYLSKEHDAQTHAEHTKTPRYGLPVGFHRGHSFGYVQPDAPYSFHKAPLRFGGLPSGLTKQISMLMHDEQKSALYFVDAPISSGRVLTSRNLMEGMEIAFKELNIIATLFLLPKLIKPSLNRWINRVMKCSSELSLPGLDFLQKKLKSNRTFNLAKEIEQAQHTLGLTDKPHIESVVENIRSYVHGKKVLHHSGSNVIADFAEKAHWIPLKKTAHTTALDLTQPIAIDEIKETSKILGSLAKRYKGKGAAPFLKHIQRSMRGNVSVFFITNLLCFLYLACLVPQLQYGLTYKITGRHQFPGIDSKQLKKATAHSE